MRSDLYARKSTADAGRSAARQEAGWRADCAAQGIDLGRVFVDPDLSASRYAKKPRPDYALLLAYIRSGGCQMVSLWEASRGSRQLAEWVDFIDLCRDQRVPIRVFSDGGRTYEPWRRGDYKTLVNEGMDAHDESERLSERVREGTRDAALRGVPAGALLYGYRRRYDDRGRYAELVIIDSEAALVRRLLTDTLAGVPLQEQARRLNAAGVPTPRGTGRWVGASIGRLLRNPGYRGCRVHHGEIVARDAWPAIITDDEAAQVEALFATPGRSGRHSPTGGTLLYLLSGAAVCAVCGGTLRPRGHAGRRRRYECVATGCGKVGAAVDDMDALVAEMVRARLRQPDALVALQPRRDDALVDQARQRLAALRGRLDELYAEAGKPDGVSPMMLGAAERALKPQIGDAEDEVRRLSAPPVLRGIDPAALADSWADAPVAVRRAVVQALAEVVLTPVGRGGRWSMWRLAGSRWRGDQENWGDLWMSA